MKTLEAARVRFSGVLRKGLRPYSVDEKLGYCQTPEQTCINRQGFALGEPCECHGMGGGVFGLDSTGKVVAQP